MGSANRVEAKLNSGSYGVSVPRRAEGSAVAEQP